MYFISRVFNPDWFDYRYPTPDCRKARTWRRNIDFLYWTKVGIDAPPSCPWYKTAEWSDSRFVQQRHHFSILGETKRFPSPWMKIIHHVVGTTWPLPAIMRVIYILLLFQSHFKVKQTLKTGSSWHLFFFYRYLLSKLWTDIKSITWKKWFLSFSGLYGCRVEGATSTMNHEGCNVSSLKKQWLQLNVAA